MGSNRQKGADKVFLHGNMHAGAVHKARHEQPQPGTFGYGRLPPCSTQGLVQVVIERIVCSGTVQPLVYCDTMQGLCDDSVVAAPTLCN